MNISDAGYEYEFVDNFGDLHTNLKPGYTHGVTVDTTDNVYVFNQSQTAVLKFDRHGKYQETWGEEFRHGAHGMYMTYEPQGEYLYLTDYERHLVLKTSPKGDDRFQLGVPPRRDIYSGPSEYKPTDVCVSPRGDIYVFDGYGKSFVHVYDKKAKYLASFGGHGVAEGQFDCPHGGWIDVRKPIPELYVADRGNHRISVHALDGTFKRFITDPRMSRPCDLYAFGEELYVADLDAKLLILGPDDKVKAVLGEDAEAPKQPGWPNNVGAAKAGTFIAPHAVTVDSRGDVYVAEWVSTGRVVKLKRLNPVPDSMKPPVGSGYYTSGHVVPAGH